MSTHEKTLEVCQSMGSLEDFVREWMRFSPWFNTGLIVRDEYILLPDKLNFM